MKVILTGATGMVGEGVLLECLRNDEVQSVLSVSRRPSGKSHPKLRELLLADFMKIGEYESQLAGYDACFYCAGISSVGMSEAAYQHITYTTTLHFADAVRKASPRITFVFVSGAHTDSNGQGKVMWARVKGETENALGEMKFNAQYNFRPSLMKPDKKQTQVRGYNKCVRLLYPVLNLFFTGCTLREIAQAMLNAVQQGYPKKTLEAPDIKQVAALPPK